ncbi:MAG: hypothetical protein RLZZ175_2079 [Bacteroidota bacterium]|jgi:hypothetical protein
MVKYIFKTLLSVLVLSIVFLSCKHKVENNEMIGPAYVPAGENFVIKLDTLYLSANNVNFSNRLSTQANLNITASFNQKVTWFIQIKGLSSKAEKNFIGLNDTVNVNWNGVSENIYFFRKGEKVEILLKIYGDDKYTLSRTVLIDDVYKYGGTGTSPQNYTSQSIGGIIYHFVDDMEDNPDPFTKLSPFYPSLTDAPCVDCINQKDTIDPVQGKYSYLLSGFDTDGNTYVGSLNTIQLYSLGKKITPGISNDDLYINMYVYGDGSNSSTSLIVFAYEMDVMTRVDTLVTPAVEYDSPWPASDFITYNDKIAKYKQGINDKWQSTIAVNWTGWKLVSLKYSDFKKPTTNGNLGGGKLQADRLSGIAIELDDNPSSGKKVYCKIDQITITENGPFKQQ